MMVVVAIGALLMLGAIEVYAAISMAITHMDYTKLRNEVKATMDPVVAERDMLKQKLERERTLTKLFAEVLHDLLQSRTRAALRWKMHVIRDVESVLMNPDLVDNDTMYDALVKTLYDTKHDDRQAILDRVESMVKDYLVIDQGEAEPIMELLRMLLEESDNIDELERQYGVIYNRFIEAARSLNDDFKVLDTNPMADRNSRMQNAEMSLMRTRNLLDSINESSAEF